MAVVFPRRGVVAELTGRRSECQVLDRLIEAVRAGESRALVMRGEVGLGKTALLDYLAGHASGCVVARVAGVQSEMELAFSGVHQLCAPMLDHLARLPVPQRDALRGALGLSAGSAPDRFLVGLAVLGLLSEVAERRPLICVVDDEQWLDRASTQILKFVARRLQAESVGVVFAARRPSDELAGMPELVVEGLAGGVARPAAPPPLFRWAPPEPGADPPLVWRAAERLGIGAAAATPAAQAGLLEFGTRGVFRHPLVRSVASRPAP